MTSQETKIIRAVLRYNGIPDYEHASHIEMSHESGRGNLDKHAFRSYKIIWNCWTDEQRVRYSRVLQ